MNRIMRSTLILTLMIPLFWPVLLAAQENKAEPKAEPVQEIEEMVVEDKVGAKGYTSTPAGTTVKLEEVTFIGPPNSVIDVFKTQALVDFRGMSELDPGVDSIYLNGFSSKRFVTAMDGITLQKTGGRKSSNIVDWAQLPTFLLESVEILPGPHTALYDAKAIGGVINMKTKAPTHTQTRMPSLTYTTSYSSYDTFSNTAVIQGGVDQFTYDLAYRNYTTDGYLRHNETDMNIGYGRLGLLLPYDGYITFSAAISDIERNSAVNNTGADFDSSYPEMTVSPWDPEEEPTWDTEGEVYRLNYAQTLGINRITAGAYYGKDARERDSLPDTQMHTEWWQQGGKIMDEIQWAGGKTTLGIDFIQLFDEGAEDSKTERIRKGGLFAQHQWEIIPHVDTTLGLRYENVTNWTSNYTTSGGGSYHNPAYDKYIERDFDALIPKSFTTWHMDHIGDGFRDTSLSVGISRIWHAPDYHGDYNPQGRPAGITLDPEHGMGYDLIFDRRLWRNINLKAGYAFYQIKDFIATNSSYDQYGSSNYGELSYSDYKINLDEVYRHGVTLELSGNLTDSLSGYLTWAWQKFDNQGNEPAGQTELDQRAEHQIGAGLRFALNEKTTFMLDYTYQSDEVTETADEVATDVWVFQDVDIPAHHVVDFGVSYKCFETAGPFENGTLGVYVKNLFDEYYYDATGYPATDRTFGVSFSVSL